MAQDDSIIKLPVGYSHKKDLSFIDSEFLNLPYWRIEKDEHNSESYHVYVAENLESIISHRSDEIYLEMAGVWSKNSHCKRMQVGCLIVKNKSIISDGYNGSPSGFPNVCESDTNDTLPYVLHAEANAITKLARGTQSSNNSTLYVTLSPCFECSKLIIQSGIKRVLFSEVYRKPESIAFLAEAGIEIIKLTK
jgi:dCMP deaminase